MIKGDAANYNSITLRANGIVEQNIPSLVFFLIRTNITQLIYVTFGLLIRAVRPTEIFNIDEIHFM